MVRIRERECIVCGKPFSYEISRGKDGRHCSNTCRKVSAAKRYAARCNAAPPCLTLGCNKQSRPYRDGLCEACYCYAWRTGKARDPKKKPYKLTTVKRSEGKSYRVLRVPGHPLAMANGGVYHHRLVAYSSREGICGPCYWCATPLEWKSAIIDHLNEDGKDNAPSNLVVSCNHCNRARGAMLPFFRSLSHGRFDELVALMLKQVQDAQGVA